METAPARDLTRQQELLAPPCLDTESFRKCRPPALEPGALRCLTPNGRSLWSACQDSVSPALPFLQEKEKGPPGPPSPATQALGPCWELMVIGMSDALNMARNIKSTQYPKLETSSAASRASLQRRPRKQLSPRKGIEKVDPGFKGVTLEFQIQPDSSLQIVPTYSLPGRSCSQKLPASPSKALVSPGGNEALGPRRCASCRTQRTPLWRDAEDGTPLCNACGIRYKKYGTRCSSCWLVPRKSIQPKTLCGRCGVSQDPQLGPTQEL
ncbi:GATA-type zinc finger protein 1 [Acomys russatus]|uniref:GATA-type zinc finger protein 1 n=1 Tax=Acomys russatus TaxID=60746 RepID=UPI0021E2B409|nr:GATA-type zinc finger protein 1 [Acomys russatus]